MKISCAPCCWGVDDPTNPHLPPWQKVLEEASAAGYQGIELGPYGYLPLDLDMINRAFDKYQLNIVAGTIFDNLLDPENVDNLIKQTHDICSIITQLPRQDEDKGKTYQGPYLVIIDWGHPERDQVAGQPDKAPRLSEDQWQLMMSHIKQIAELAWEKYGVRAVLHPHAGGYIEYADEIQKLVEDLSYDTIGLCLDTGHLYYSKMDPEAWLIRLATRIDYVHFKDIDQEKYDAAMDASLPFFDAVSSGVMCPIGTGVLDYAGIRQTLLDIGYQGFITVEQERDPRNAETSLRDVKASRDFLSFVGFN